MFDNGDSYAKLKISHLPRQFNCENMETTDKKREKVLIVTKK